VPALLEGSIFWDHYFFLPPPRPPSRHRHRGIPLPTLPSVFGVLRPLTRLGHSMRAVATTLKDGPAGDDDGGAAAATPGPRLLHPLNPNPSPPGGGLGRVGLGCRCFFCVVRKNEEKQQTQSVTTAPANPVTFVLASPLNSASEIYLLFCKRPF